MAMLGRQGTGGGPCRAMGRRGVLRHGSMCLIGLGAVALLAAACSSSGGPSSSTGSSISNGSAAATAVVRIMRVTTYGEILTDSRGNPLYTLSGSCTGSCASAWPALTVPSGTVPTGGAGVTGTLSAVKQPDGTYQVAYNGSPLYTFVQDSPGQVTGQGVAGFTVVKVSGSATTSTTGTSGRGTGY